MKRLLKLLALVLAAAATAFWWYFPCYQLDFPEKFIFEPANTSLQVCINNLEFNGKLEVEGPDPRAFGLPWFKLHFLRHDVEMLTLGAHASTVFCCAQDTLYFAVFHPGGSGCRIEAYDLSWGWRRWRTELNVDQPVFHSLYYNRVTMALTERTVIVSGQEAYSDYIEILDRRTGISMGHKTYRKGFIPMQEGDTPFIGRVISR